MWCSAARQRATPARQRRLLTEAGRVKLTTWMRELLSKPVKEYPQFTGALSIAGVLPPAEVAALLRERADRLEREVRTRTAALEAHMEGGLPRLFLIEEEHRVVLAQAELEWVRELASEISEGTIDGIELWRRLHAEKKGDRGA